MIDILEQMEQRFERLNEQLADPAVLKNPRKLKELSRERRYIEEVVRKGKEYRELLKMIAEDESALRQNEDAELVSLARSELQELRARKAALEEELKVSLTPPDPKDEKNVILELRAGTGGEEAALFVADLHRMYTKYVERNGWSFEIMSTSPSSAGGFKEIILLVSGEGVFGRLRFESGVHRVQRVPVTEASGRIHTSAVTVAVLPEAEDVDVEIDPGELEVDVFRSSGPGGQSVNTTDSAVRIRHLPTGIVVTCQDERSQHKNKAKAMKVLRARLKDMMERKQEEELAATRRTQVGSGDRSAKIRTYNFPQGRVTDHRIGLTLYKLQEALEGDIDDLVEALRAAHNEERLKAG